jgi:iron complex outermembrane recepter protein
MLSRVSGSSALAVAVAMALGSPMAGAQDGQAAGATAAAPEPIRLAQAGSQPAAARTGSDAPGDEPLEEVIVTGTAGGAAISKLDASFAISTVSAAEISRAAPTSTADLFKTIPGVWSESSGGVSGANVMVRGLPGGGDAPFVTVQVDGVPVFPSPTVSFLENSTMFRLDETIQRMEALRGGPNPVFSNGQPGLTTNFILREGGEATQGTVKYTTSDYDLRRVDGLVSGKLSEDFYYVMGGYLSSSPGIRDAGFQAEEGSQFTMKLTRHFERGTVKVFHRITDDHGTWYLPVDLLNPSLDASYTQVGPLNRRVMIDRTAPAEGGGTRLERASYDMGEGRGWDGSLTGAAVEFELGNGITFADRMSLTKGDADTLGFVPNGPGTTLDTLTDVNGNLLTAGGTTAVSNRAVPGSTRVQQFGAWVVRKQVDAITNDLSLAKAFGDSKITLGYYSSNYTIDEQWALGNTHYYEQRQNGELIDEIACAQRVNDDNDTTDPGEAAALPQGQVNSCAWNYDVDANGKATSDGLYLAGTFKFGALTFDGGVRFSDFTRQYTADTGVRDGVIDTRADTDESKTSFTAAVNWAINDTMGVFARINQGYLPPEFDNYREFQKEFTEQGRDLFQKISQYELGYKMSTGPLALYATFFANEVDGFPTAVVGGSDVIPKTLAKNEARGLELDVIWNPIGDLSIDVNATFQETEIQNGDNRGREVARQPPFQVRLTPSYFVDFGNGIDANFYATLSMVDDRWSEDANATKLDAYEKVDLGVLVHASDLTFQVAVDNATDEQGLTEGDPRSLTSRNGRYILPRNVKFSVGYNF